MDERQVVGIAGGEGAASWGMLDEHRLAVNAATAAADIDGSDKEESCVDPVCNDPSHDHSHSSHDHSSHGHSSSSAAAADAVASPIASHDHDHSHSHSHDHSEETTPCAPTCNDPTHDHSHGSHAHSHSSSTSAEERFGITSFVYRRRRPFHPIRLSKFLQSLGRLSINSVNEIATSSANTDTSSSALKTSLLRSKGFVWMATSSSAAYFLSHAGQYLELVALGRWWADIPESEWPPGAESDITADFSGDYGDRRQEIVFIGQFSKSGSSSKQALEEVLDICLLTDEEMENYNFLTTKGENALRKHFAKSL